MKESLLMALWVGFLFVSLGITARLLRRSWLAPGAFFTLYWSIAAVSPLIFSPYEKVSAGAVMWIFFSTLAVFSGDLVGALSRKNEQQVKENVLFSASQISFISVIVIFCSIVGMVSFVIIFNSAAQNLSLLSVQDFVAVARKIADTRYTRAYKPFLTQFLNMFLYAGPLFGGLLVGIENRRRYLIIAALPMLPAVLMTAIFILRGFIIISILLWIGSYLGTRVLVGSQQLFTKRHLVIHVLFQRVHMLKFVRLRSATWQCFLTGLTEQDFKLRVPCLVRIPLQESLTYWVYVNVKSVCLLKQSLYLMVPRVIYTRFSGFL